MKRKIIFCLIFALCLSMFSGFAAFADEAEETLTEEVVEESTEEKVPVVVDLNKIPDSYTKLKENKNLELHMDYANGDFVVKNKATGALWFSNPLDWQNDTIVNESTSAVLRSKLMISYLNATFATIQATSEEAIVVTETYGESHIVSYIFNADDQFFTIPLMFTLKDDYLEIELMIDRIDELSDSRILQISLLPMFGAGNSTDNGYLLLPDGTGSLMKFNQSFQNLIPYEGYVYEKDPTLSASVSSYTYGQDLTESIRMPIYGFHKNGNGALVIMTEGESQVKLTAYGSGMANTYNYVYPTISIRDSQTRRTATGSSGSGVYYTDEMPQNFKMRIYPLGSNNSDYVGMAKKYRSYLMNDIGMKELAKDTEVAVNITFIGAYKRIKHFLGFPYTGVDAMTTFDQVSNILTDLSDNGVKNITASMMGWSTGGLEDKVALDFDPEGVLGGKKDAEALLEKAKELNYTLMFDQDLQRFYATSGKYNKYDSTVYGLDLAPVAMFPFILSVNRVDRTKDFYHLYHPDAMMEIATNFVSGVGKSNGIKDFSFSSAGVAPYAAYNVESISTRDQSADKMTQLFNSVAESTDGIISTNLGNEFVFPAVNNVVDAPIYGSHMYFAQTEVPVYQLAYRGLVRMAGPVVNLSPEDDDVILHSAQTGMGLYYILSNESSSKLKDTDYNSYYSCEYSVHKDAIIEANKKLAPVYDAVESCEMTGYEMLDSNVNVSTFANGAKVYVNYGEIDATVNGIKIPARDFVVTGGAK